MSESQPTIYSSTDELQAHVGEFLGSSDWLTIEQVRIDEFANATGDQQWIHVDPERAKGGPFGATIAHGWLTASLLPVLVGQIYKIDAKMAINVGTNKMRFTNPVKVGSRVRASSTLVGVEKKGPAVQLTVSTEIEIEGEEKPALVVETVGRYFL
ncbi:MaoC family dehydratase [Gordonia polyisoprenivorans]|uniref:MaoC family dehydratase n=1 Tax=Gordonia polyisoprenivorans TaxID=84595 RepID=UPI001AD6A274|nr:MaoC family dehydratase [Gordonia polyisoprenivorans]QTI70933.1 MaoC family dehydratase [Gordonia polyisoprenivorans]